MRRMFALIAAVCLAPPAVALQASHTGSGEAVLLPYYSARAGQSTLFAVTNHSDAAKAVRVVIAEGRNGRVALSFNVYLAARDSWHAALTVTDREGPRVLTGDASCTSVEIVPTNAELRDFGYTGSRADQLGTDAARLAQGQIEIIELGRVTGAPAANIAAGDCNTLRSRFQPGGSWAVEANTDLLAPDGGLSAEAQVIDVAAGIAFDIEAFTLHGFSAKARHGNGRDDYQAVRIFKPVAADGATEFVVDNGARVPVARAADAVSLLLMTSRIETAFLLTESVRASTDVIVSFPTRPAYLDNLPGGELAAGAPPVAPFAGIAADLQAPYCVQTTWRYLERDGDLGTTRNIDLCEQVNRLPVFFEGGGVIFPTGGIAEGRVRVDFNPADHVLTYSAGPGSAQNGSLRGLPVAAMSLIEVRNNNAQPGRLASYAITGRAVRTQEGGVDF